MAVQSTENPTDPDALLTKRHAAREARQLRAIDLSEFLEMELPARENVLTPWLPFQGLAPKFNLTLAEPLPAEKNTMASLYQADPQEKQVKG